jgi:hypothetical protein
MNTDERRRLREQAAYAAGLIAARRGAIGPEWCAAYGQDVGRLLEALDERDALLRVWLTWTEGSGPGDMGDCPLCTGQGQGHLSDCPVPATRTLLAMVEERVP